MRNLASIACENFPHDALLENLGEKNEQSHIYGGVLAHYLIFKKVSVFYIENSQNGLCRANFACGSDKQYNSMSVGYCYLPVCSGDIIVIEL